MKDAVLRLWRNRYIRAAAWIAGTALLVLYPLRHVNVGVDLWDGGYNCANFRYSGLDYMDPMWYFATWLANGTGSLLMKLPYGTTLLGINVYTGLIVSITAAVSCFFCVGKLRMPAPIALVGNLAAAALCWLPASVLYCYLTYLLLLAGICLLYQGLVSGKKVWLVAAGALLGWNVGVRFSNLVQTGLILAVWAYGIFAHKKLRSIAADTGFCILGYAAALGSLLFFLSLRYGLGEYAAGIARLFQMTEDAVDYKPAGMISEMFRAYAENSYWTKRFLLMLGSGLLVCLILPGKLEKGKKCICVLIAAAVSLWLIRAGFNYRDYAAYDAIFGPCIIVFEVMACLAAAQVFSRGETKENRLFSVLLLLVLFITPLGGNNAAYASINNMFLTMPGFLWLGYRFCRERKEILAFPVKCVIVVAAVFALTQCVGFGEHFVYEGAAGGRGLTEEVQGVPVLKGMRTEKQKAESLEGLYQYLQENALGGRECILYGYIPGIAFFMEMEPAMNTWGDLRSYGTEYFQASLDKIGEEIASGTLSPAVILERRHGEYLLTGEADGLFYDRQAEEKLQMLGRFMKEYGYEAAYHNERFTVYLAP